MSATETFRLLVIHNSTQETERLISMLNSAGYPNRAQQVTSLEALEKLLEEQIWDILIAHNDASSPTPAETIKQIRSLNRDVPMILLTEEHDMRQLVDGLKMGAADVITVDEDQHLLLVIDRELSNREHRRSRRQADRKFKDSERRCQQLLDSSRDGIAYIQDGLMLYANDSFAERFGYEDKDDIECMPLIDLVTDDDQDKVKSFLKQFLLKGEEAEDTRLEVQAIDANENNFKAIMEVANAIYEDEPCLQFMMRAALQSSEEMEEQIREATSRDAASGLFNRQHMHKHLEQMLHTVEENESSAALLYIAIDQYDDVVSKHGASAVDLLAASVGGFFADKLPKGATLGRFADWSFLITLPDCTATQATEQAESIRAALEEHVISLGDNTLKMTASVGVSIFNELSTEANAVIDEAHLAADKAGTTGNSVVRFEPEDSGDENAAAIASDVQEALAENRFKLLFQPIISLRGDENEHYEVLLRMVDKDGSLILPEKFLHIAAKANLVEKIDRWVIVEATKLLSKQRASGHPTRLMINITADSLKNPEFGKWVGMALKATKLPGNSLIFECSEAEITANLNQASQLFGQFQELECFSCISRFGCSLNPLSILKNISPTHIKMDGSFTQDSTETPEALTDLVSSLNEQGKQVIVPLVEHASVLSTLWQAGVHYIQGHYLQAPTNSMDYDFSMDDE